VAHSSVPARLEAIATVSAGASGAATLIGAVTEPGSDSDQASVLSGDGEHDVWKTLRVPGIEGGPVRQLLAQGEDLWLASDAGLFRSRDLGETWARFGGETLWSSRVTRLCRGPGEYSLRAGGPL